MPQIIVKAGEPIDVAIRKFKRVVEKEGVLRRLRNLAYYIKPNKRKQLQKAAAGPEDPQAGAAGQDRPRDRPP